jgi:hypothetical protein
MMCQSHRRTKLCQGYYVILLTKLIVILLYVSTRCSDSRCHHHVQGFVGPTTTTISHRSTKSNMKNYHHNGKNHPIRLHQNQRRMALSLSSLDLMIDTIVQTTNAILIATIDSDIATIPENEFKPVFMGGVVVMFGGLISALIVGFIVDSRNLYANLVADSYAQASTDSDEEFWKGLSEEEKNRAQALLKKVKEQSSSITSSPTGTTTNTNNESGVMLQSTSTTMENDSNRIEINDGSKKNDGKDQTKLEIKKTTGLFNDYSS